MKRVCIRIYQRQTAHLYGPDPSIELVSGEKSDYDQTSNAKLQYDITVG